MGDASGTIGRRLCDVDALVDRRRLNAYFRRLAPDPVDREDLLSETIARVISAEDVPPPNNSRGDLLLHCARAAAREWARVQRRERAIAMIARAESRAAPSEQLENTVSPEEAAFLQQWVQGVLARLSPTQRAAIELRYRRGYSYSAVAAVLHTSESTARVHVLRGLRRLRSGVLAHAIPPAVQKLGFGVDDS